jgi:hypothetical protein
MPHNNAANFNSTSNCSWDAIPLNLSGNKKQVPIPTSSLKKRGGEAVPYNVLG